MKTFWLAAILVVVPLSANGDEDESHNDIYIGTIETDGQQTVLSRCDLGKTPYILRNRSGESTVPVREYLDKAQCGDQRCYGVVVGSYQEDDSGHHQLVVSDMQDLTPGKSCHLMEAVEALFEESEPVDRGEKPQ